MFGDVIIRNYDVKNFFLNIFILRRPGVVNFADKHQNCNHFLLKKSLKTQKKVKRIRNCVPNVVGDFNDENTFTHKLLLTNMQDSKLLKAFANGSLANMKLSKT